jgi:hypothetical protein
MNWTLRITQELISTIRSDLRRPHPFAAERVGFAVGVTENAGAAHRLILLNAYTPVSEDHYLDDPSVGARISGAAIRNSMQLAMTENRCVFHVHMHDHRGRPSFSRVDLRDTPRIVQSLCAAQPLQAHGALLLSSDTVTAAVWLPGSDTASFPGKVIVVGEPMQHSTGLRVH